MHPIDFWICIARSGKKQDCHLGDLYTESGQTLQGSLSASSKPIFATKYSFESSRRDLHNTPLCTAFQSQIFVKNVAEILRFFINVANFC